MDINSTKEEQRKRLRDYYKSQKGKSSRKNYYAKNPEYFKKINSELYRRRRLKLTICEEKLESLGVDIQKIYDDFFGKLDVK